MSDEAILGYVKSIDERTARMEVAQAKVTDSHDKRIKSLENSRTAARAGLTALTIGGGTGAAKAGMLGKVLGIFGSGS